MQNFFILKHIISILIVCSNSEDVDILISNVSLKKNPEIQTMDDYNENISLNIFKELSS